MQYEGIRWDDELGGGLNNLIMNLAQILHDSCRRGSVLVLPNITTGWRFFSKKSQPPLRFGELFDEQLFIKRVRPCLAAASMPANASFRVSEVKPVVINWPYARTLPRVYAALRPNARLRAIIHQLETSAIVSAGPRWTGVHLRIERDWWDETDFCRRGLYQQKRCYLPSEAALVTREHRKSLNSTGTVLFYAANNVPTRGPRVDFTEFGAHTTKVALPEGLHYTMRATVEFFLAARAKAGFYGNSFSTFTRGVSLLRRLRHSPNGTAGMGRVAPSASFYHP